jgi:signal transduction histidine kinase
MDFSKLHENKQHNARGTGLGLSICKKLIEKMKGKIEVRSNIGEGTNFIITMSILSLLVKEESKSVKRK